MFTGIIEEIGTVAKINRQGQTLKITIKAKKVISDVTVGDSIAVNGVCLTVTSFNSYSFTVDVMPVTFNDTSLHRLKSGSRVNLERAMAANGRFGGHIVSGHVDEIGTVITCKRNENAKLYRISISKNLSSQCYIKGSIAVDGTSLTIFDCGESWFEISLIPHTQQESIIGDKNIGDLVNVECDILIKQRLQPKTIYTSSHQSQIDESYLKEHGFL